MKGRTGRSQLNHHGIAEVSKLASQGPRLIGEDSSKVLAELIPESKVPLADVHGLLAAANIPRRHNWEVPFRDEEQSRQWSEKTETLLGRVGGGFLVALLGPRGTGKTQAAVYAIVKAAKAQRTGLYAKAFDVFLDIRATYTRPDRSERDALERYIQPQIVVLDEIQQRGETPWEDRMLAYLLDRRYDDMKDTILVGNLTADALQESLDPSIVDRLRETGGIFEFAWQSFRVESHLADGGGSLSTCVN